MLPLNVALIGFGYAGQTLHAPLIRATAGLHLRAVVSSDAAKVHAALGPQVSVFGSLQALLDDTDVDLVVIATPNDLHHPQAAAALAAGRHVVIDKPFAVDAAQALDLVQLARRHDRLLSVFHNRRWDSDFLTLRQLLAEGRVGRPVELVSSFDRFRPQVRQRWREGTGPGAGLWLDLGPHLIDQALQLFGWPTAIWLDRAALRDGALADDWFQAQLRWDTGAHAGLRMHLHASTLAALPAPRFTLHGLAGSIRIDGLDPQEARLQAAPDAQQIGAADWGRDTRQAHWYRGDTTTVPLTPVSSPLPAPLPLPLLDGAYPHYYAGVRDAVLGRSANPLPPEQALWVQQLLDAGIASARDRRELELGPAPS
jgi:predicted dehydrogenase